MLSLAGTPLALPTPEISAWVRDNIDPARATHLTTRSWPGFGLQALSFPNGFTLPKQVILNRLLWPRGASRFAIGHFLADSDQTEAIREVAFGKNGNQNNPVTLIMTSPNDQGQINEQLTTTLFLLPPMPLAFVPPSIRTGNAAYMLTVVCQRFWWWQYGAPDFGINDSSGKTWTDVFNQIESMLNIDLTVDPVDPDYLQPSQSLNLQYENIPQIFDACATSVGMVVVNKLNNSVAVQTFATASSALDADAKKNPWRSLRAGTDLFQDDL